MITVGMDEVGRGCWAGPLVAGAVILPESLPLDDLPVMLRDSKKLSKLQRDKSNVWIRANALAVGLGWVEPGEIDVLGISKSVRLAFTRALEAISLTYDELILDGNINYFPGNPKARAVIKADDLFPCVSAASIVAKVARDDYMASLGGRYAPYAFEKHVGYGTKLHIDALRTYGVSDLHRRSYKPIKALLDQA